MSKTGAMPLHSQLEAAQEAPKPASRGTITADPELTAMNKIARLLNGLEPSARDRCVDWLMSKFGKTASIVERPS